MKIGVMEVPPFTLVFLRVGLAALILFFLLKIQGRKFLSFRHYFKHFFVMGVMSCALPFTLLTYSEKTISSSLAGLINGCVPIFATTFAHFLFPSDRLNPQKVIGIFLGIVGLAFVFIPSLEDGFGNTSGIIMVVIASIGYAGGMVYSKKHLQGLPPLIAPVWQLIVASCITLPLCLVLERPFALPFPSWNAIAAIIGLALIGSALAFILYYRIIEMAGASYLSLCTLLFPLIALSLGAFFLGETLTWNAYVGGAFILSGLGIATELVKRKKIHEIA